MIYYRFNGLINFRELITACSDALAGKKSTQEIGVDKVDKSLVANFEILNLVPEHTSKDDDGNVQNKTEHGKYISNLFFRLFS